MGLPSEFLKDIQTAALTSQKGEPVLSTKTDEELISSFLQGEGVGIEELIQRYERPIYFLCLRMVDDHEDALELVQKTFVNAIEHLQTLQKLPAFKPWLYKIAVNLCLNLLRERSNYTRAISALQAANPSPYIFDPIEQEEQKSIIRESLGTLPEKQRATIILRIYQDLSYPEISEVLGCQESTVRSHFHLGLKKLAVKLKDFVE